MACSTQHDRQFQRKAIKAIENDLPSKKKITIREKIMSKFFIFYFLRVSIHSNRKNENENGDGGDCGMKHW